MAEVTSTTTSYMSDRLHTTPARRAVRQGIAVWLAWVLGALSLSGASLSGEEVPRSERKPRVTPDYTDLVIPPNLAPLNFAIEEPGRAYHVRLCGPKGEPIAITARQPRITIPPGAWREFLLQNRGHAIQLEIRVQDPQKHWLQFATITNQVADEAIDPVLIYRKIYPSHNTWSEMGIYQRNLETFEERPVLENRRFGYQCCHCHALAQNDPASATVIVRSRLHDNSLLVISNGVVESIRGTVGFNARHPSGRVMAVAISKPRLLLHTARNDMREIAELSGWLGYLPAGSTVVQPIPTLVDTNRLLAFPLWSPDGRYLYCCSAPNPWTNMSLVTAESPATIRYDLARISYDVENDRWGKPETILPVSTTGFSVAQPRISPNGRWLFFCAVTHGCWPTYDPGSDLYALDLETGERARDYPPRKLELNSPQCESWLSWSANSRWVVFSSKRNSPLFNRPHLSHVSPEGHCSKPFVVPQKDPTFYDFELHTYTIPTLAKGPITASQRSLARAIRQPDRRVFVLPGEPSDRKPPSQPDRPAGPAEREWPTQ